MITRSLFVASVTALTLLATTASATTPGDAHERSGQAGPVVGDAHERSFVPVDGWIGRGIDVTSTRSVAPSDSGGFAWREIVIGAAGGIGAALLLGAVALTTVGQRRGTRVASR